MKREMCVVNKFSDRTEAEDHARRWSAERTSEVTVIYASDGEGLMYFVEEGDGGMIRNSEMLIARYRNGRKSKV